MPNQTSFRLSRSNPRTVVFLNSQRQRILSKTGGWFPGKGVFTHGYSMMDDLIGQKSYCQILVLNATGRLIDRPLADWIEAIFGCMSWPDPRIWCNQIGALAGSAQTSVAAAAAMGALAAESRAYGPFTLIEGCNFIRSALQKYQQGMSAEEIVDEAIKASKGKVTIAGYKRPIAKGDERLEAMEFVTHKLKLREGKHLALAYEIEKVLLSRFDEGMNISGYICAFLSDYEFTAEEIYRIFAMVVTSGVTACYLDVLQQPTDSFLPLRCDDMDYQGIAPRALPTK